jgi:AcrR family transcriptional regulator
MKPETTLSRAALREAIIRTSLELGAESGEDGLTIRGIASRLGISITVIYQHFDNKAAILQEIRLYGLQRLIGAVLEAHDQPDLRSSIIATSHAYIACARDEPWLYRTLFEGEGLPSGLLADDQREHIVAGQVSVREAVASKLHRVAGDRDALSRFLVRWWTSLHGVACLIIHRHLRPDHALLPVPDVDAFIADYVEFLADSLLHGAPA